MKRLCVLLLTLHAYTLHAQDTTTTKDTTRVKTLHEVNVQARLPTFEKKPDRIIYNIPNSTYSIWEQLIKLPGVKNESESLSYTGNSVGILINDRPLQLSGPDLAQYLRALPASDIERVEIITTPPARYDASGGILINIILKKRVKGVYGAAQSLYEQGRLWRLRNSLSLNLQRDKFGFTAVYSFSDNHSLNWGHQETQYPPDKNISSLWTQQYNRRSNNNVHSYRLSADYFISHRSTLSLEFSGVNSSSNSNYLANNQVLNNDVFDSTVVSSSLTKTPSHNYISSLTYRLKIDSTKELFIYGDYTSYNRSPAQQVSGYTLDTHNDPAGGDINFNLDTRLNAHVGTLSADYTSAAFKHMKLETGLKYANTRIENLLAHTGDSIINDRFIYNEQIYAGYASLSGTMAGMDVNAGARLEYTNTLGRSITGLRTPNHYIQFFPSLSIGKKLHANYIDLSYSRRISRPEYYRLNPFRYYGTTYEIYTGNPFLQPSITNRIAASYTYNNHFYITFYYTSVLNSFQQYIYLDSVHNTLTYTHVNFGEKKNYGFYTGYDLPVTKWWQASAYLQVANQIHETLYQNEPFRNQSWRITASLNNAIKLSAKLDAELNGWYEHGTIQGIFQYGNTYAAEALLRRKFGKAWTVAAGVTNIFLKEAAPISFIYAQQSIHIVSLNDTRQFRLNLIYRFGKKSSDKNVIRKKSGEDERDRI
jgi:hypothetical protein